MATEEIKIKVSLTAGEAAKELDNLKGKADEAATSTDGLSTANKTLKQQLKEAVKEAQLLSAQFGESSKEAFAAQKKVANLKEEISDFGDRINALNPEAKFAAVSKVASGIAGGFAAAQGAMALFGDESESGYDREIALARANGKDITELEKKKLQATVDRITEEIRLTQLKYDA